MGIVWPVEKKAFKVLLSEKERKTLESLATESGMSAGAWLRLQIRNAWRLVQEATASRKQGRDGNG